MSILASAKALLLATAKAVAGPALQQARRLRAQRLAASGSALPKPDRIAVLLDETIGALTGRTTKPSWWHTAIAKTRQRAIGPDVLFRGQSLWAWLDDLQVKGALRTLAARRLDGPPQPGAEETDVALLKSKYEELVGDAGAAAGGIIDVVLDMLVAGVRADLTSQPDSSALSLQLQATSEVQSGKLDNLAEAMRDLSLAAKSALLAGPQSANTEVARVAGEECERRLRRILLRRSIPNVDFKTEIAALASLVDEGGDFWLCPEPTRKEIYQWAARLHAGDASSRQKAERFRAKLLRLDAGADTLIIDAWLEGTGGDWQAALRRVREAHTSDAHTSVMGLLRASDGPLAALAWLDSHPGAAPDFLTGLGWLNAAVMMAQAGRWEDAVAALAKLDDRHMGAFPDLYFVDGVLNAAQLYPAALRGSALAMAVEIAPVLQEGAEADRRRQRALASFEQAAKAMRELDEPDRAKATERWRTWLLLTDKATRTAAEATVAAAMSSGETAVDAVELAAVCNVETDIRPLERHLQERELSGGLNPPELVAKLIVYRHWKPKPQLVQFLTDNAAKLDKTLMPGARLKLLILALVENDDVDAADAALRANHEILQTDYERLADLVRTKRGEDILPSLEARYERTGALLDLGAIWEEIIRRQDHERILQYGRDLFQQQRTAQIALAITVSFAHLERFGDTVAFLEGCSDLVDHDPNLAVCKAWALFYEGAFEAASQLVDRLLSADTALNLDLVALEINLSVATARWEHFGAILDREWPRRDQWPAKRLLQLAFVCAEADRDRAVELAQLAACKDPEDPDVLAAAYLLVTRLGREDVGRSWMLRAAQLSKEDGPVRTGTLPEALSLLSANVTRTSEISTLLSEGKIPLLVACSILNTPITKFLVTEARRNEREPSWRHRSIIPLRHGGRLYHDTSQIHSVTADLSSLILLADVELLQPFLDRFDHIRIPWSTTQLLMTEFRECQFHQPSRIEAAHRLHDLAVASPPKLCVLQETSRPPEWLLQEIAPSLAELFEAARINGGRVVSPSPIFRNGSLMEQHADLREYAALVLTTTQLAQLMREGGVLDQELFDRATAYLKAVDAGDPPGPSHLGEGPLYLDGLAVTYLTAADLFERVPRLANIVFIHAENFDEAAHLVASESDAAIANDVLSRLRAWLRDGIASGKISILPSDPASDRSEFPIPTLRQIILNFGPSDAVLLDDRYLGQHAGITDKNNKMVPTLGVVDLLRDFADRGLIDNPRRWAKLHILRARGFSGVPLEPDELEYWLTDSLPGPDAAQLRETAELRTIREYLLRLQSTKSLHQPAETGYLDRLRLAAAGVIRHNWAGTIPIGTVAARASWLYTHVVPSPIDWKHTIADANAVRPPAEGLANQIGLLLPPVTLEHERADAFSQWLDAVVLQPLAIASGSVLDRVTEGAKRLIDEWAQQSPPDHRAAIANQLIRMQPPGIYRRLTADEAFLAKHAAVVATAIGLGGSPPVWREDLWSAVRAAYADGAAHQIISPSGETVRVTVSDGGPTLTFERPRGNECAVTLPQLGVLSPDLAVRQEAIGRIAEALGPGGPDRGVWQHRLAAGPPDDRLITQLFAEMQDAIPAYLGRISLALAEGQLTPDILVPEKRGYYEKLCGPAPETSSIDAYLTDHLTPFRQALIDREPVAGLQLCLALTLRDDISCVGLWHGTSDELWSALEQIDYRSDPFSMLGVLDLALHHAADPRFAGLADRLIHDLSQPCLDRGDGIDIYAFYPALIDVVQGAVALLPALRVQPAFWRSLCSWAHAAAIARVLQPMTFDVPAFTDWCLEQANGLANLVTLLDMRQTPAFVPGASSGYKIRAEVLGRLTWLRARYTDKGWPSSGTVILDRALEALAADGLPGSHLLPGPLEGDRRPQYQLSNLPEEAREGFYCAITKLASGLSDPAWTLLAYYARFCRLDDETRKNCIAAVQTAQAGVDPDERARSFGVLANVAFVALVRDWPDLAEAVLALCLREANAQTSPPEADMLVRIALIAAAAFPIANRNLNEFLFNVATRVAPNARQVLHDDILAMKYLTPAEEWNLSQPEAMAAP